MNFEEAKKKYGILVPTDEEFYSEEYNKYFYEKCKKNGKLQKKYSKYKLFNDMFVKSFYATFYSEDKEKLSNRNYEAVVLGGQTGAGKSSLASVAKQEFLSQGKQLYLIDDDIFRKFYPKSKDILDECPEFYTKLTAIGSGPVTPKIMKYASDRGLNFLFDGTLKNSRIINTAMQWKNYKIDWKVIATSKIESMLSIFERNENLRKIGLGRLITVDEHNATYSGLEGTIEKLESIDNVGRIQIYGRGTKIGKPILCYDNYSKNNTYKTAVDALNGERKLNKIKCIKSGNIERRIQELHNTNIKLNDAELSALNELETSIKSEIER